MPTLTPRQQRDARSRRRAQKIVLAIVGSLLLHGLVLLVLGWLVPRWPRTHLQGRPLGTLKVTILPSSSPTPTPSPGVENGQPHPEYMRTDDDQATTEKIKDPNFISHQDTLAASELDANGEKPLPSQQGKEVPTFDFKNRPYRPGDEASQAASAAPSQAAPAQSQSEGKPQDQTQAKATPPPENPRQKSKQATSQATPSPKGELAVATPEPSATPEPPAPTPEKPSDVTSNQPPQPIRRQPSDARDPSLVRSDGLVKKPGYQPNTVQTKMSGNINNRGKSAVMALGTPLGRYIKNVQDAIGALWYFRVDQKMDVLSTGQVKVHFYVNSTGKVLRVRVSSGDPNSALASVSIGAVMEADIPPMPPDLPDTLPNRELEADLGFDMY